ncbi:MAG: GDP-L-fucose synthase [Patescibacteria group bacterium]
MEKNSKIYIAGHNGLVGSAIVRALEKECFNNLILKTRQELNLLNYNDVANFFKKEKPEYIFLAAAKVGGILANKIQPADFIYENLTIQNNIIHNAYLNKVKKLLFLGSSCIYPKMSQQPVKEEFLLTSELEATNKAYAVAKISGITMCQAYNKQYDTNFISLMPTNLYGPNDNFDLESSHVLPALIRKFHEAKINNKKEVKIWGTGRPKREFLHVDDLANASIFLMKNYNDSEIINVGTEEDISIKELANTIKNIIGFSGDIIWDKSKPDGTPKKLLDANKLHNLGWYYKIKLEDGIKTTYEWYKNNA